MTKMYTVFEHKLKRGIRRCAAITACGLSLALFPASPALARLSCTAGNVTLNYGAYDVVAGTVLDAAGTVTVSCTKSGSSNNTNGTVSYTIALTPLTGGDLAPPSGTDRLTQQLFIDSARSQPWGNGTSSTYTLSGSHSVNKNTTASGSPINFYARVTPGGQDVAAATYTKNNFTVTVSCTIGGGIVTC